jgi:2-polyprenylphenol 6-hydroxylase
MSRSRTDDIDFDIIVCGGGIAGTLAALDFARNGFSVMLLDDGAPTLPGAEYAMRVVSINPASEAILKRLEVWPSIVATRVSPFDRIEVWEEGQETVLEFDAADAGLAHLAHIVENDLIAGAARACLEQAGNHETVSRDRVANFARSDQRVDVTTGSGRTLSCRLLVGADGTNSTIRKLANIDRSSYDYRQQAVVARVVSEHDHGGVARQKFLATGPLAFLPLADGSCSIVWSLENSVASEVLSLDDNAFARRLEHVFDGRLGAVVHTGPRVAFPLRRSHATHYVDDAVALIGDACHTVHPLAGLGANQGIADAHALVDVVTRARDAAQQFWKPRVLAAYQRRRRPINSATLAMMDLFHFGFANDSSTLAGFRSRFLTLVNRSTAAKRYFVRHASGLTP